MKQIKKKVLNLMVLIEEKCVFRHFFEKHTNFLNVIHLLLFCFVFFAPQANNLQQLLASNFHLFNIVYFFFFFAF